MEIKGLASDGNITVDISTHDGAAGGLMLGGTLVTSTATELNLLDGKAAANLTLTSKVEGTDFTGGLLVGHSTTGTLSGASNNTGVGIAALDALTSGDGNTCVGGSAGTVISSGSGNSIFGYLAGLTVTGINNVFIGKKAGEIVANAHGNICIGEDSGNNITSGDGNLVIGYADVPSATADHQLSISSGQSSGPTWMTGDSSGNIIHAGTTHSAGGQLSTTGKSLVMGF